MLKSIYLSFREVKIQRVTVVEFGMYDRSGDDVGCLVTNRKSTTAHGLSNEL